MQILKLAVITPIRRLFDYLPASDMSEEFVKALEPGIRIVIPFGGRSLIGVLQEVSSSTDIDRSSLKPITKIIDKHPLISKNLFELCKWATIYYHHPPGEVFGSAFSVRLRRGSTLRQLGIQSWRITEVGIDTLSETQNWRGARKQLLALQLLQKENFLSEAILKEEKIAKSTLYRLEKRKLIEQLVVPPEASSRAIRQSFPLSTSQSSISLKIKKSFGSFRCHLIDGVTGSGKTEIYMQLIHFALRQEKQVLLLIPEINLTPQTISRLKERFQARVSELHSGLTDSNRDYSWTLAYEGFADIVVGTRSACFAPCPRLGLIIIDEEHDRSYKQQDGFRYSARDTAVKRAQIENCPIVLGSATPSLETLSNAKLGRYSHHRLTERVGGANMPSLSIIDVRGEKLLGGLSSRLLSAISSTLNDRKQVLLFLNRRGYSSHLQCHDCGWIAECTGCDARLTLHRKIAQLRCHYCGKSESLSPRCHGCGSDNLLFNGLGTQQTEEKLSQIFGETPIYRVDSDSIPGKLHMKNLITKVDQGHPCILIGTQMLAKGHHFPNVTLAGILDVDSLLFGSDFRGEERMAQLITQVAGRAGRESITSEVLLQTHYPDNSFIGSIQRLSYANLAERILENRRARSLPPSGYLVVIRTDSNNPAAGETFLMNTINNAQISDNVRIIGPVPSAMPRRAGKYRHELIIHTDVRLDVHSTVSELVSIMENLPKRGSLNWFVDVDPVEIC